MIRFGIEPLSPDYSRPTTIYIYIYIYIYTYQNILLETGKGNNEKIHGHCNRKYANIILIEQALCYHISKEVVIKDLQQ